MMLFDPQLSECCRTIIIVKWKGDFCDVRTECCSLCGREINKSNP